MAWPLSERVEGLRVFACLGPAELLSGGVAAVSLAWCHLRRVDALWAELCARDFPMVAEVFANHPCWAPPGPGWHDCYRRLARARLAQGILCPGCGNDMLTDLVELFQHLLEAAEAGVEEADAEGHQKLREGERAAIPMLAAAERIETIYRQDARSALPGDLFQWIVEESCQDYMRRRAQEPMACRQPLALCPRDAVLKFEEFLEYFRELLIGDDLRGEAMSLVRSLRPWSTAATHNLIRLLCDPEDLCHCSVEQPPELAAMRLELWSRSPSAARPEPQGAMDLDEI